MICGLVARVTLVAEVSTTGEDWPAQVRTRNRWAARLKVYRCRTVAEQADLGGAGADRLAYAE